MSGPMPVIFGLMPVLPEPANGDTDGEVIGTSSGEVSEALQREGDAIASLEEEFSLQQQQPLDAPAAAAANVAAAAAAAGAAVAAATAAAAAVQNADAASSGSGGAGVGVAGAVSSNSSSSSANAGAGGRTPASSPGVATVATVAPGATPRVAFVEQSASAGPSQSSDKWYIIAGCLLEAAVMAPTLYVEAKLSQDLWAPMMRITIASVRLSPAFSVIGLFCSSFSFVANSPWMAWLNRLVGRGRLGLVTLGCLEVRWGVAITLDMWYLLSTPLSQGLQDWGTVLVLIANVLLCFGDTVLLIVMLASKNEDPPPPLIPPDAAVPRPFRYGQEIDEESGLAKFDPTCVICLGEFNQGDEVAQLPCGHTFHEECVGKWLLRQTRCPLRCPQVVVPSRASRNDFRTPVEAVSLPAEGAAPVQQ